MYGIEIATKCINIIYNIRRFNKKVYPVIIPIIIYSGKEKIKSTINEKKNNLKCNIVQTNKYSKADLLKRKSIFSYFILISRSKDKKELIKTLNEIEKIEKNQEYISRISKIAKEIQI